MKKIIKNEKIILIFIILLAAILRLISLDKIPTSLYHDEVLSSYEAYSILTTGQDQWGNPFPLNFKAFGDYVPPLYFYFNVPFVFIFGLTEWAVRIPAALLGILTVWLTYFLTQELFKNTKIALGASFLMAISPWHFHYSRIGFPAIMLPFLISLGLWLFFRGINKQNDNKIYLSIFCLSLTIWTYSPAQVFTPLLLLGLLIFYRKQFKKRVVLFCLLITLSLFLPFLFLNMLHPEWRTRFSYISVLNTVSPIRTFLENYFSHFSFKFLFSRGDQNLRHHLSGMGQLYIFELPFLIYFFIRSLNNRKILPHLPLLLYWLIIFPISSSLTIEDVPHATRSIVGLPLLHILSTLGFYLWFKDKKVTIFKKPLLYLIFLFFSLVFALSFMINYFSLYPKDSANWFFYGQKEAVEYIKENYQNYEKIIISGKRHHPYLYLLFYLNYSPEIFQKSQVKTEQTSDATVVNSFDKFEFKYTFEKEWEKKLLPKTLYVEYYPNQFDPSNFEFALQFFDRLQFLTKSGDNQKNPEIKKIIYFPDGSIAYRILSSN